MFIRTFQVAQWVRIFLQRRRPSLIPESRKIPWRRKWQPTPVFLPGESHDRRAWRAKIHWVAKNQTQLSNWVQVHSLILWCLLFVSVSLCLCVHFTVHKKPCYNNKRWVKPQRTLTHLIFYFWGKPVAHCYNRASTHSLNSCRGLWGMD